MESDFGLSPKGRQLRRWIVSEQGAERAGISLDDVPTNDPLAAHFSTPVSAQVGRFWG
jgi:hypothetical protein